LQMYKLRRYTIRLNKGPDHLLNYVHLYDGLGHAISSSVFPKK